MKCTSRILLVVRAKKADNPVPCTEVISLLAVSIKKSWENLIPVLLESITVFPHIRQAEICYSHFYFLLHPDNLLI